MSFIVYALPRSRTFWFSKFLTYGGWSCGHDELRHLRAMEDIGSWFKQPFVGTIETAAAPWWRLVQRTAPEARTVVIRRQVGDVIDSLMATGIPFDRALLHRSMGRLDHKLDQIEQRIPGVLSVSFDSLNDESTCARVFEHCLQIPHDGGWYARIGGMNLQVNLNHMLRYLVAHADQIDRLGKVAKQRELAALAHKPVSMEGITFQQESFADFFRDGKELFADHLSQVGEPPEALEGKNTPLMQALEDIGLLQVTTARCNGRMFGYLMAVISPSLESPDITSAIHTTFFASSAVPGLGLKLQHASVEALRARGVNEVLLRAGTRGSGPKMAVLYRRMGAEFCGSDYLLPLTVH